jgi:radical SAM superfamily enzyme YgiQ (UPF0313 family)
VTTRSSERLVVNPEARVSWVQGRIHLSAPWLSSPIKSDHPSLLHLLQFFSEPSSLSKARRRLPGVAPEELDGIIRQLKRFEILVPVRPSHEVAAELTVCLPRRGSADSTQGGITRGITVLFVVPVDLCLHNASYCPHPTGLFLANIAHRRGHHLRFVSEEDPGEDPLAALQRQADVVLAKIDEVREEGGLPVAGLSCFSSALYQSTMLLGAVLRARHPDLPILVGGHHPAIASESLLAYIGSEIPFVEGAELPSLDGSRWLDRARQATQLIRRRRDRVFDYIFAGRADRSFPDVLDGLKQRYRRPDRPLVLPPSPFSRDEMRRFRYAPEVFDGLALAERDPQSIGICFSFGCPQRCSFCIQSSLPHPWCAVEPQHAIETLTLLHDRHGVSHVVLGDANFGVSRAWRQHFLEAAAQASWARSLALLFEVSVLRFDVEDPGLLDRLDLHLQVGVETASREMLKRVRKAQDPDLYLARLKRLIQELSPHTTSMLIMLIVGLPGETKESLIESFRFLFEECRINDYPRVTIGAQPYLPLAGTESVAQTDRFAEELGFRSSRVEWWFGAAERRFAGLRPSRGLSLDYCHAIVNRIEKGNVPAEWTGSASEAIRKSERGRLASWLSNPLIAVQSCRMATRKAAQTVLDQMRRAAAAPELARDGSGGEAPQERSGAGPGGVAGWRMTADAFRSVAERSGGASVLEMSGPEFVGRCDFARGFETEILSLEVGHVLPRPIEKNVEAGYWLIQRVE